MSNFTFRMNTSNPDATYPDSMRYWYVTPEGIESCETDIFKMALHPSAFSSYDIWVMRRTDSEGTGYVRSTVSVEDIGIVDVAYYEGYSNSWYIASTGQAVNIDTDGIWRLFGDPAAEPWTPYFFG